MRTYLNTPPIFAQSASKVDRNLGIISNIVVAQIGEAKGHDINLDSNFLNEVVNLASKTKTGIKARFGHPNICTTALGTYLGRYKNYHRLGDQVLADLHLDKSAQKSPNGNLYDYVLDMAENNPDMFGASIAFKQGKAITEFEEINGKKVEKIYATIKALYATDLVDSPAATDGLFEAFHQDDFSSQVTIFLDDHPQIYELLDKKPEILNEFLNNYKHYKTNKTMNFSEEITNLKNWITDNFKAKTPEGLSVEHQSIFDNLKSEFESKLSTLPNTDTLTTEFENKIKTISETNSQLSTDNLQLSTENETLTTSLTELQTQFDTLTSEFNQLKATKTPIPTPNDPEVNLNNTPKPKKNKVLESMPPQLRKKLKTNNQ